MARIKTKTILRAALLISTIISLFFVPWPIVAAWIKPLPATIQDQVNQAVGLGFDGIIVYIDENGRPPALYAAGTKNRENNTPADPHSLFKIASVGKLYIAVAIVKLVTRGKLSLDKTLANYLPELKGRIENADGITVRMLITHRSGIPNFTDSPGYWAAPKETGEERLNLVLDLPADFPPDEDYRYSNTNYLLLGRIMDKVLGYDRFQFIQESILQPLDLHDTYGSIDEVNIDDVMSGYYVGYPTDVKTDHVGSMLATASDLGIFIRALNDGSIFENEREQALYTSLYRYEHTGLLPGYQTIAKYHKDMDAVVIQFTNTVDFQGYNWNLSEIEYNRIVKILKRNHDARI